MDLNFLGRLLGGKPQPPAPVSLRNATPAFKPTRRPLPRQPLAQPGKPRRKKFTGVLLGGTGQGKSTLVNLFVNYFRGPPQFRDYLPRPQQLLVAIPTVHLGANQPEGAQAREFDVKDRSKSQSTECINYNFTYQQPGEQDVQITIVDTPGLSDTSGHQNDDINMDKIFTAIGELDDINAIILVANGSEARINKAVQNTFVRLRNNIPNDVLDNTLAVLTNCTDLTRNLDPNNLPVRVTRDRLFHVQNSAFSTNPKRWAFADWSAQEGLNRDWCSAMNEMTALFDKMLNMTATGSSSFQRMQTLRNQLKTKLAGALAEFQGMQAVEDALAQAEILEKNSESDAAQYADYTKQTTVKKTELVDRAYHSTLCMVCQSTCHDGCGLQEIANKGDPAFGGCWCFSGSRHTTESGEVGCNQCEQHCGPSAHYHARAVYQTARPCLNG